jgi:hypothetical protein
VIEALRAGIEEPHDHLHIKHVRTLPLASLPASAAHRLDISLAGHGDAASAEAGTYPYATVSKCAVLVDDPGG